MIRAAEPVENRHGYAALIRHTYGSGSSSITAIFESAEWLQLHIIVTC